MAAHLVNLAMLTKDNGKRADVAITSTWNAKTMRLSPLKMASGIDYRQLKNAAVLEKLVKSGQVVPNLF